MTFLEKEGVFLTPQTDIHSASLPTGESRFCVSAIATSLGTASGLTPRQTSLGTCLMQSCEVTFAENSVPLSQLLQRIVHSGLGNRFANHLLEIRFPEESKTLEQRQKLGESSQAKS